MPQSSYQGPSVDAAREAVWVKWDGIHASVAKVDHGKSNISSLWSKGHRGPRTTLLNRVSGYAPPGQLTAIMGPSGAGKSSLLDVLAGRLVTSSDGSTKTVTGNIQGCLVRSTASASMSVSQGDADPNPEWKPLDTWANEVGYVLQDPHLLASATVAETIETAARLRLPRTATDEQIKTICKNLIEDLELSHRTNAFIGNAALKGLSGGEMKRVSVAVELVHRPRILFLDEPTTGLDSSTSLKLITLLRRLTRRYSCTIIMTIHQPNAAICSLFDQFILMGRSRSIYCGPWDSAVDYFSVFGYQCPLYSNPSDYLMDLLTGEEALGRIEQLASVFRPVDNRNAGDRILPKVESGSRERDVELQSTVSSEHTARSTREPETKHEQEGNHPHGPTSKSMVVTTQPDSFPPISVSIPDSNDPNSGSQGSTAVDFALGMTFSASDPPISSFHRIRVLARRFGRDWSRNPLLFWAEFGQHVFISVFVGLIYLQVGDSAVAGLFDRNASLFFLLATIMFTPAFTIVNIFETERRLLIQEVNARMYSAWHYFVAKTVTTWPVEVFLSSIFSAISYFMIGYRTDSPASFFRYLVVICLFMLASESLGFFTATLVNQAAMGSIVSSIFMIVYLAFGGFLVSAVPSYFQWIPRVSYFNYAYSALVYNELEGLALTCTAESLSPASLCTNGTVDGGLLIPATVDTGLSLSGNIWIVLLNVVVFRIIVGVIISYRFRPAEKPTARLCCKKYSKLSTISDVVVTQELDSPV